MRTVFAAIAFAIALPSIAHAQAAPTPTAKEACCKKMKSEGMKPDGKMMEMMKDSQKHVKGGTEGNAEHKH